MRTKSEELFESFCRMHGIAYRRVSETTEPTPDYELEISGQVILAEVKQFDPNPEEQAGMVRVISSWPSTTIDMQRRHWILI